MTPIARLLGYASSALVALGTVVILLMTLHVTADVLLKLLFNRPIIGTLEIVTYVYMVACIYLPLPHVQAGRALIIVELFTQRMSSSRIARLDALGALLTFVYLGMITWRGGANALEKTAIGETADATFFELPVWPMRWVMVGCCAIAALIALSQVFEVRHRGAPPAGSPGRDQGRRLGELEI